MIEHPYYHVGYVARDLDCARGLLGKSLGLEWGEERAWALDVDTPEGRTTYHPRFLLSRTGPPYVELVQAAAGTVWRTQLDLELHHLGFWSTDLATDAADLVQQGWPMCATLHDARGEARGFSYHRRSIGEPLIELVDASMKPTTLPESSVVPDVGE